MQSSATFLRYIKLCFTPYWKAIGIAVCKSLMCKNEFSFKLLLLPFWKGDLVEL